MILENFRIEVEARAIHHNAEFTIEYLSGVSSSSDSIISFIDDIQKRLKGKLAYGTLRHYVVISGKIDEYSPAATFKDINLSWLQGLEKHIREKGLSHNTVSANMRKVISILNKAESVGLIDKKQFSKYKSPTEKDGIPVYLTEKEIKAFHKVVDAAGDGPIKTSGYYFLLSCYAGYRISDLKAFKYSERVSGNTIVLRAKKNGNIVSIPIYPALKVILTYCKKNELKVSEQDMRGNVRDLAKLAGIKSHVKVHSGRHTFAMLMLEKGLTVDEVAELLGDSKDIAKRYARISNKQLHRRVLEVMK